MKTKQLLSLATVLFICNACFHIHLAKVPKGYIRSVEKNLPELTQLVLSNYDSNTYLHVDSVENDLLRHKMRQMGMNFITVHFHYETPGTDSADHLFNDSLIMFTRYKTNNYPDPWETSKDVIYYFGVKKPLLVSKKEEFSDITLKLNDSMEFVRSHQPQNR